MKNSLKPINKNFLGFGPPPMPLTNFVNLCFYTKLALHTWRSTWIFTVVKKGNGSHQWHKTISNTSSECTSNSHKVSVHTAHSAYQQGFVSFRRQNFAAKFLRAAGHFVAGHFAARSFRRQHLAAGHFAAVYEVLNVNKRVTTIAFT